MKYSVEWLERVTTSTGKNMLKVTLKDEKGVTSDNVAIWDGFPNFADMKSGDTIEGDLVVKQNGQYENKSLYAPKPASTGNFGAPRGVSKLMDKKAENIKEAQERKSESIAYFNSVNSAIALVSKMIPEGEINPKVWEAGIRTWRDWFLSEYEKWNKDLPVKNPPF